VFSEINVPAARTLQGFAGRVGYACFW